MTILTSLNLPMTIICEWGDVNSRLHSCGEQMCLFFYSNLHSILSHFQPLFCNTEGHCIDLFPFRTASLIHYIYIINCIQILGWTHKYCCCVLVHFFFVHRVKLRDQFRLSYTQKSIHLNLQRLLSGLRSWCPMTLLYLLNH